MKDNVDGIRPKGMKRTWREKRRIAKFQKKLNKEAEKYYRKAQFNSIKGRFVYFANRSKENILASLTPPRR